MSEFHDQSAIVVGGARGIGHAVAASLLRLGARVTIADLGCDPHGVGHDPDVVAKAARSLDPGGERVLALAADAAQAETPRRLIDATVERFGRVDFGVYCAGYHHERALLRASEEEIERVLALHLWGAVRFTRELARSWVADKRSGAVVLASSSAAFFGSANQSAQAMASGALVGFVKTAATELRRHNIRVNAVVPTARTRLTESLPLFASIRPESLTSEHVAQVVAHLLSAAATDVRGEIIGVAGGRVYAIRHSETSGAFHDGPPATLEEIAGAWRDVTRR